MQFQRKKLNELTIEDEKAFKKVPLYAALKDLLVRSRYTFRVLPATFRDRWDHALLLNLTYWGGEGDVLVDSRIPADVVTHAAWHFLTSREIGSNDPAALFLGEAIASGFDLFLVGQLLRSAQSSSFLSSQVTAMAETANAAGMSEKGFRSLLETVADEPEESFEQLRRLLFDTSMALYRASTPSAGLAVLERAESHKFGKLLHRYELSNWVLYARAYASKEANRGAKNARKDAATKADRALRKGDSLDWLVTHWLSR